MLTLATTLLVPLVTGFGSLELAARPPQRATATFAASARLAHPVATAQQGRRAVFEGAAAALVLGALPQMATASGGATAGKYTTIPIAKRRYFGRVKQGVFEYLSVGAAIKKGELDSSAIDNFFADTIQVSESKQKRQCIGNDASCRTKEKFSSRWEDLKLSMFLLGNAFRTDSGKPPEKVKQVKEAQAFFVQVDKLRKARAKGDRKATALSYAASIVRRTHFSSGFPPLDRGRSAIRDCSSYVCPVLARRRLSRPS